MRPTNLSSVTEFTIRDAREIFELCFPEDCADAWEECVRASISPRIASHCLSAQGIAWAKYYLATSEGSPAGISALYQHVGTPDEIWFGWFGVHPAHQGK